MLKSCFPLKCLISSILWHRHSWCGTRLRAGRCWWVKWWSVPEPCVGRPWQGVAAVCRCLDHWWVRDACSEQQACISTFVASMESPTELSIYQQHPKQTKTFHTICPPVQRRILLKLVLPCITYWCLLPACVGPLSLSYSYGGEGSLGFHKARADSLAHLFTGCWSQGRS